MRRLILRILSVVTLFIMAFSAFTGVPSLLAQEATPTDTGSHPIVGTWIVDTVTALDSDPPEVGIFHGDGTMSGLGANRVAGGTWEVVDDTSVRLTLVTVADSNGVGNYVVVRGTHVLDDSGNRWSCDDCTFTVVGADGTVLDSGEAPASATRMPVQGPDAVGTPLEEVPVWVPMPAESATPEA